MSRTTLNIPVLSSTAGINSDGVIFGSVNESPVDFIASKRVDATAVHVYRRDSSGSGTNFVELSTPASNATTDDVAPFGTSSDMSSGDSIFISDTDQINGLYVQVTTSGDWAGTGFKIYDSTDGITANRELLNVVDPSDGFRAAPDWYKITWDEPVAPAVAFSPVPGDIPTRKYVVIKLNGFTSCTTAPLLGRVVTSLDSTGHRYTNVTSIANGSTSVSPGPLPDYFPDTDEETIAHLSDPAYGFERYLFAARTAGIETVLAEYLASDNTWKTMPDYVDASNNAEVIPSTSPEKFSARWTIPSDWTLMTNSILMSDNTTHTATAYWFRVRVTAVSAYGFIPSPLQRIRIRKFGASTTTGIVSPTASSFTYLNIIDIGGLSGVSTVAQVTNMNTGRAAAFTIPAAPTLPLNIDITDINFAAGEKYAFQHVSGAGSLTGIQLILE